MHRVKREIIISMACGVGSEGKTWSTLWQIQVNACRLIKLSQPTLILLVSICFFFFTFFFVPVHKSVENIIIAKKILQNSFQMFQTLKNCLILKYMMSSSPIFFIQNCRFSASFVTFLGVGGSGGSKKVLSNFEKVCATMSYCWLIFGGTSTCF